jgi:beta-fructofuranosidase
MSTKLQKARDYEELHVNDYRPDDKPLFHLSPMTGWMNDPNGFSIYKEQYHMFYQYHPYDKVWGPMHWGHAVSADLIRWEYRPCALAPDMWYDAEGCFSGSAVETDDGRHLLIYTGVTKENAPAGEAVRQEQCIAVGDGYNYEKLTANPIIKADVLPEGISRADFRDPKIIRLTDGTYRCLMGSCVQATHDGCIQIFSSDDCINWKYENQLLTNNRRFGRMWECPDLFMLDGTWVLLTSPQDMLCDGGEFHSGDCSIAILGDFDPLSNTFREHTIQAVDCGPDFYAMQTVLSPDGRRLMIGWMQNWDTFIGKAEDHTGWFGQMSVPRELFLKNGHLCQRPASELNTLRRSCISCQDLCVKNQKIRLDNVSGRTLDLDLNIRTQDSCNPYALFRIYLAENESFSTRLNIRPYENTVTIDRECSGSRRAVLDTRTCSVKCNDGSIHLRIIMDRYSIEVFTGDGEHTLSICIDTPLSADRISLQCIGSACADLTAWTLGM